MNFTDGMEFTQCPCCGQDRLQPNREIVPDRKTGEIVADVDLTEGDLICLAYMGFYVGQFLQSFPPASQLAAVQFIATGLIQNVEDDELRRIARGIT